jgi:DNA repair photolyase
MRAVVEAALDAGASHVSPIMLHLRPGVREEFLPWLQAQHPDLVERYEQLYRRPYGPRAERDAVSKRVRALVDAHGRPRPAASHRFRSSSSKQRGPEATQAQLW